VSKESRTKSNGPGEAKADNAVAAAIGRVVAAVRRPAAARIMRSAPVFAPGL